MTYFFRLIRWPLGQIITFINWLTLPKPRVRTPEAQQALDVDTADLSLYQFKHCPFCVKTRRVIHRLGLNIELRDARNDANWHRELIEAGGKYQVPCLRIAKDDGSIVWMYESTRIGDYLNQRFG